MVKEVLLQIPVGMVAICRPVNVHLEYVAGDRRRRDMPAVVDSLFHILEKAGVVEDDTLLWVSKSSRSYDKENPRATITFDL
jgi:Holliday junction resolvase RusA-like endonuclease